MPLSTSRLKKLALFRAIHLRRGLCAWVGGRHWRDERAFRGGWRERVNPGLITQTLIRDPGTSCPPTWCNDHPRAMSR